VELGLEQQRPGLLVRLPELAGDAAGLAEPLAGRLDPPGPERHDGLGAGSRQRGSPPPEPGPARAGLPGVPDLGPGPAVQLWPHRHGTDAMFVALLRRTR